MQALSVAESPQWELKELSEKHKQVCALLAQGEPRHKIAAIVQYTPEYITMLAQQPLCREYIARMSEAAAVRLEALFDASVDAIADTLQNGSAENKLKAARLQMEATHRVGASSGTPQPQGNEDRLIRLAERLTGLLERKKGEIHEGTFQREGAVPQADAGVDEGLPAQQGGAA